MRILKLTSLLMVAVLAFLIPDTGLWLQTKWINYLLMIIMFGFDDFQGFGQSGRDTVLDLVALALFYLAMWLLACAVREAWPGMAAS